MQDYELPGKLYLGRVCDVATGKTTAEKLLYDNNDLVTHAVCVGMTGSGKTGLCLDLLEEAAIDGIPTIAIDPKGDIGNIALTFPQLRGEDFRPWVNVDEARVKGLSPEAFADDQAARWKKGLSDWDQDGQRIEKLRESAEVRIYTPGSTAGLPVSILRSFSRPDAAILADRELLQDRIGIAVSSLLTLVDVPSDPLTGREHIFLANLFDNVWTNPDPAAPLTLDAIVTLIQNPPKTMSKIGAFPLETFYPSTDRTKLAMKVNTLLAAPSFRLWLEGEPLDIGSMFYSKDGRSRVSIFSIAHLSDSERMFFVSLLLNELLGWVRSQRGTTSLRALFYMDEIFGYFPPVANPPSKMTLLTLLKQSRAYGLGLVLATQNPVDLDYKGLSNCGTWFIGRLQTERDKMRVLEGLQGAAVDLNGPIDRSAMEKTLAGLGSRKFLMNNVHQPGPVVFESRWAMSYLRGPLGRSEIKTLMDPLRPTEPTSARPDDDPPSMAVTGNVAGANGASEPGLERSSERGATPLSKCIPFAEDKSTSRQSAAVAANKRPILPASVQQLFLASGGRLSSAGRVVYQPRIAATADVYFNDKRSGVELSRQVGRLARPTDTAVAFEWEDADEVNDLEDSIVPEPDAGATYLDPPEAATRATSYTAWKKSFADYLYRTSKIQLLYCEQVDEHSFPDEPERDFRIRIKQKLREQRDAATEKLRVEYDSKRLSAEEKLRQAEQRAEKEKGEATTSRWTTALTVGTSLLGAFLGRKRISVTNATRVGTAVRQVGYTMKQSGDVGRAEDNITAAQQKLEAVEAAFANDVAKVVSEFDDNNIALVGVTVSAKRTDIKPRLIGLAWVPQ